MAIDQAENLVVVQCSTWEKAESTDWLYVEQAEFVTAAAALRSH